MSPAVFLASIFATLALAAVIVWQNLWRAVLWVRPGSVRIEPDAPGDQMELPEALSPFAQSLEALGFARLGTHEEKAPLRRMTLSYNFVDARSHTFATLYEGISGQPQLYFLTRFAAAGPGPRGFVLTANFKRPIRDLPGYRAGGVPGADPERVWKLHQRRCEGLALQGETSLEARVAVAREWYSGAGRQDVRQQNAQGVFWTSGAVLVVLAMFFGK